MPSHHCTRELFQEGTESEQSRYIPGLGKCKTAHHFHNLETNQITNVLMAKWYTHSTSLICTDFSGPSIWNNLDEELKSLSLHSFKQTMNKQFLSTYA